MCTLNKLNLSLKIHHNFRKRKEEKNRQKKKSSGDTYFCSAVVAVTRNWTRRGRRQHRRLRRDLKMNTQENQKRKDQRQVHFRYGFMLHCSAMLRSAHRWNIFAYCTSSSTPKIHLATNFFACYLRKFSQPSFGIWKVFYVREIVLPDNSARYITSDCVASFNQNPYWTRILWLKSLPSIENASR